MPKSFSSVFILLASFLDVDIESSNIADPARCNAANSYPGRLSSHPNASSIILLFWVKIIS